MGFKLHGNRLGERFDWRHLDFGGARQGY
jgi:hypothetical protein